MKRTPLGERRVVYFSGRVQGVGFRYTTRHLAQGYDVRGFVRNLVDGRVQLVVEGQPGELQRFVQQVEESLSQYIDHSTHDIQPATGEFTQFEIRHERT